MKKMNSVDWIATVLTIIGALNWGLVGAFRFNLVTAILGETMLSRIVFIVVGLAGLWAIYGIVKCCKSCDSNNA